MATIASTTLMVLAVVGASLTQAIPQTTYIEPSTPHIIQDQDLPEVLLRIGQCESNNRQTDSTGKLVRGHDNQADVGRFQINETYWLTKSKELNFDIYTWDGNTQMALWIYNHYGTKPWMWSSRCWTASK